MRKAAMVKLDDRKKEEGTRSAQRRHRMPRWGKMRLSKAAADCSRVQQQGSSRCLAQHFCSSLLQVQKTKGGVLLKQNQRGKGEGMWLAQRRLGIAEVGGERP
eukprot:CAMPEP_0196657354 /NCGR_PEP_ID=MMETSP1086-20130531/22706_1 /TAXON_ID=77921 /ORGANISM="Cyanoptyche  gloeocystis , Strain SAG4.97" /LENGTH=102 /DNA_ID=CAMNT_0041990429 /DNA_START=248 /DNA_END=556 /DNA_ORIENTATION=-